MSLTKTAITRPVFMLMLMLAAFMIGTISYNSMRVEQNPEVNFGVVSVTTPYPGAGPEDINELISRKVEEAVAGVNGVREITSTSVEGVSAVVIQLELGVNTDAALNDVRSKVDGIANSLPKDALKSQVTKFDNGGDSAMLLSFRSDRLNSRELRDLIDTKIRDRFAQISGVAQASVIGGDTREVQVRVKRDKLMAYGIGILDLQRAVAAGSVNAPSGRVVLNDQEFAVRVKNDYTAASQIKDMIITVSDPKSFGAKPRSVRLKDVADVEDTVLERQSYARLNGEDSINMNLSKTREGNAVEIDKFATILVKDLEKEFKDEGLKIIPTFRASTNIVESLADVRFALIFGIILVSLIVYVFLHDIRGTIIVAIAIPTSIFATFIAMKAAGFTINNLSMLALSLAVGVLVDDAIVVLENIYRHLRMGEEPVEAAINGRNEIGLAALAITMADVVVFLPIAFMGGIVGQFYKPLALGFVFAVIFSLFVSFTITPLLAARWYKKGEDIEHNTGRFAQWFDRGFRRFEDSYRRSLEWALKNRWFVFLMGNTTLVAVFMFIGGSFAPDFGAAAKTAMGPAMMAILIAVISFVVNLFRKQARLLTIAGGFFFAAFLIGAAVLGKGYANWKQDAVFKFQFLPEVDAGQVRAKIELPTGSSLTATDKVVKYVEDKFRGNPDVKYVTSSIGQQGGGSFGGGSSGSNFAEVTAVLYEKAAIMDKVTGKTATERLRARADTAVAADLVAAVGRYPGASVNVSVVGGFNFGSAIQLSFVSENREQLIETTNKIRERLAQNAVPGVINADVSSKAGKPELRVVPDRVALADQGVTALEVGQAVRTAYQGDDNVKMRIQGKEYVVRTMLDREDRDNPEILRDLPLKFSQGQPILLSSVATVSDAPGIDKITRRARSEEITVTADLLPGYANGSVAAAITAMLEKEKLVPADVKFRPLGQADAQQREAGYLFAAIGIGLVLVYMLLASLYDNLLYPFIIQLSQPQALVGALLALVITDKALNVIAMIGVIALIGLVGKNAILVVDYTNTLRERGKDRHDALVEAGPTRLRPIMMTTLALILGTLPVALAIGRGSEFRETIGITIIGGILVSTFLTLLVIPCSYTIFDDLSNGLGRVLYGKRYAEVQEARRRGKIAADEVVKKAEQALKE